MLARVLLSALAALAMVAGASAQTSCPAATTTETCTSSEMTSTGSTSSAVLNIFFTYCAPNTPGYGSGVILPATAGGALTIQQGSNAPQGFPLQSLTGSITTGAPSTSTQGVVPAGLAPILSFNSAQGVAALITINNQQVAIQSNTPVYQNGIVLPLTSLLTSSALQDFDVVTQDQCGFVRGDPLFSGFRGQQFYVGGEDGQVMNMISTFNMQLNGRFVTLNEGAAITPAEQEKLRLASQVRHIEQPEVAAFPHTTAWSHPGNYFGEAGVALLDNNRLYAKAGSFETGFSKVALNGRPLTVSSEFVVLGSGANTTYVQRVSAHEVMVRTVNVEFTLTNSDNFLNVEQVHLERGFRQHNKFGGLLGKSVDEKWQWNAQDEQAAVVQSNDLFAHDA